LLHDPDRKTLVMHRRRMSALLHMGRVARCRAIAAGR